MKDQGEPDLVLSIVGTKEIGRWTNRSGSALTIRCIELRGSRGQRWRLYYDSPVTVANGNTLQLPTILPTMTGAGRSLRTRGATDMALRLLCPVDRQRYREEWAAELADLPRRDQAAYAYRLLSRAWTLRRELGGKPSRAPRVGLAVMVVIPGADAVAALCGLDWQATVLGLGWTLGVAWVVSSKDRTEHMIALIRETRSGKAPAKE